MNGYMVKWINCQIVQLFKKAKAKAEAKEEGDWMIGCLPRRSVAEAGIE